MRILKISLVGVALCLLAGMPASASTIYSNGPINGAIDAFNITTDSVANSFTVLSPSTVASATFGAWLFSGDTMVSVDWQITNAPLGGTVLGSGTGNVANTPFLVPNSYNYDVYSEAFSISPLALGVGTYWFQLQNATTTSLGIAFWDENDGPSAAVSSSLGDLSLLDSSYPGTGTHSESFQLDSAAVPEPGTIALLGCGIVFVGLLRRKPR